MKKYLATGGHPAGTLPASLHIPLTSNNQVDVSRPMTFELDGKTYTVTRDVNSNLSFSCEGVITDGVENGVKAEFDSFFNALGFGYEGAKYITPDKITKNFGVIAESSYEISWPAGYVTAVNPNAQPPQTGDSSVITGYVMIALAVMAAAVIFIKKARA